MKHAAVYRNKLQDWERQKQYQEHLHRMKSIGSQRKARDRKQDMRNRNLSIPELPAIKPSGKSGYLREVDLENERIMKKLDQIGRRKSQFVKQSKDEKNYYTINLKSRAATRKIKYDLIQQENDLIVERILQKRSSGKSLFHDQSFESRVSLKKSRKKSKKNSSILSREVETHPELSLQDI